MGPSWAIVTHPSGCFRALGAHLPFWEPGPRVNGFPFLTSFKTINRLAMKWQRNWTDWCQRQNGGETTKRRAERYYLIYNGRSLLLINIVCLFLKWISRPFLVVSWWRCHVTRWLIAAVTWYVLARVFLKMFPLVFPPVAGFFQSLASILLPSWTVWEILRGFLEGLGGLWMVLEGFLEVFFEGFCNGSWGVGRFSSRFFCFFFESFGRFEKVLEGLIGFWRVVEGFRRDSAMVLEELGVTQTDSFGFSKV